MLYEARSPDGKTVIKIDVNTDKAELCTSRSPEKCEIIIGDHQRGIKLLIERMWHKGWMVR